MKGKGKRYSLDREREGGNWLSRTHRAKGMMMPSGVREMEGEIPVRGLERTAWGKDF